MSDLWLLLVDPALPQNASAVPFTIELETRPGKSGLRTDINHGSPDIQNSAHNATHEVCRILRKEAYLRGMTYVDYVLIDPPENILGRSAELALALGFATEVCHWQQFRPIVATGVVEFRGAIRGIDHLPAKLLSAFKVLPKGGQVLYPKDNQNDITENIRQKAIVDGVELIAVEHLHEALLHIGIKLDNISFEPFRGLEAYRYQDRNVFRGRGQEVQAIIDKFTQYDRKALLIIGASGSGKSSVMQAGVVPTLEFHLLNNKQQLRWSLLRPRDLLPSTLEQAQPWVGLIAACRQPSGLGQVFTSETDINNSDIFTKWMQFELEQLQIANATSTLQYLWIIDQLEELFTQGLSPKIQEDFITTLHRLISAGHWLLMGLRNDFVPQFQESEHLQALVGENWYLLPKPTPESIDQMILEPAELAECAYQQDKATSVSLATQLRQDMGADTAALPLLSFTLQSLYEAKTTYEGKRTNECAGYISYEFTYDSYQHLGKLHGAIGNWADNTYNKLNENAKLALPGVLRKLVTISDKGIAARVTMLSDFSEKSGSRVLVEEFIAARLMVNENGRVRLVHEALLTSWYKAEQQINKEKKWFSIRCRLETEAKSWLDKNHFHELLLPTGLRLEEAKALRDAWGDDLDQNVRDYIQASEWSEWNRRWRRQFYFMAIGALVMILKNWHISRGHQEKEIGRHEGQIEATNLWLRYENFRLFAEIDRLDLLDGVTEGLLKDLNPYSPDEDDWPQLDKQVNTLLFIGDIYLAQGKLDIAREYYDKVLHLYNRPDGRYSAYSNKIEWQQSFTKSCIKVGTVMLGQNDLYEARMMFSDCYITSASLAEEYPNNTQFQGDLAESYNGLGIVRRKEHEPKGSLNAFYKARDIFEQLVAKDGNNIYWQSRLWRIYLNIGGVLLDNGDFDKAIESLNSALKICDPLAKKHPKIIQWQKDIAVIYFQIASVRLEQNKLEDANEAFLKYIEIREHLVSYYPTNKEWQSELGMAYGKLGWTLTLLGQFADARAATYEAKQKDPNNSIWTINLGHIFLLEGDVDKANSEYDEALPHLQHEDFQRFLVDGLELFVKKGWQVDASRVILERLKAEARHRWPTPP